jgi:release factor glutamine methyltransferase
VTEQRKRWRIIDLLNWTTEHLQKKGIDSPRLTTERLLAHVLGMRRVELYLQYDRLLTSAELQAFKTVLQRRLRREPLQYVLGETEFYGLRFKVTPAVLIPRPETEVLVEQVIHRVRSQYGTEAEVVILDVGTGSGNIAVALAHHLKRARVTAVDLSSEALAVARENAALHAVEERIDFVEADFAEFAGRAAARGLRFDVVVSNPPYVDAAEFDTLAPEVREHEPRMALVPEGDVLSFYRTLAEWAPRLLSSPGVVAVEVGLGQAEAVRNLFAQHKLEYTETYQDLSGIERVVLAAAELVQAGGVEPEYEAAGPKEPVTD